jgi:hypothetical protein
MILVLGQLYFAGQEVAFGADVPLSTTRHFQIDRTLAVFI